jgi:FkbM family methyltransferase
VVTERKHWIRRTSVYRLCGHSFLPALLSPAPIVLDVGANHGDFTTPLVDQFHARVTAVEPNPALAGELAESGAALVLPVAVAEGQSSALLVLDANDECSSILPSVPSTGVDVVEVEALSLSSVIDLVSQDHVDLVKLDVEGAEVAVLEALDPERLRRVVQLAVEFHDRQDLTPPRAVRRVRRLLARRGFDSVRMSLRHRGDVLFVQRTFLTRGEWWWLRWVERPRQIVARTQAFRHVIVAARR